MLLVFIRTVILYLLLILSVRLMGKRQIGEMEPTEFVVTMLVANLAAIPMQDGGTPLFSGIVPIATVLALELILSGISFLSIRFRKVLCGKPVILIFEGKVDQDALRKTQVTQDELTGHLREKDILDIRQVQYAILETNGQLSVFPYPKHLPATAKDAGIQTQSQTLPVTIVSEGKLLSENLNFIGKDETWAETELRKLGSSMKGTWILTADRGGILCHIPREETP